MESNYYVTSYIWQALRIACVLCDATVKGAQMKQTRQWPTGLTLEWRACRVFSAELPSRRRIGVRSPTTRVLGRLYLKSCNPHLWLKTRLKKSEKIVKLREEVKKCEEEFKCRIDVVTAEFGLTVTHGTRGNSYHSKSGKAGARGGEPVNR